MKILITGHKGMLGSDLMDTLGGEHQVTGVDLEEMDVGDLEFTRQTLRGLTPDLVIHTASYNAVDDAETNWKEAFRVNAVGTQNVALAAHEVGAALVHFSTDYIFDGTKTTPYEEWDMPNPQGVYARSKAASEWMVRALIPEHFIVRVSWLVGHRGKNFVEVIINKAEGGELLSVVDDQAGSPTFVTDVIQELQRLIPTRAFGTYHMSCNGTCTWYDLAKAVLDETGLNVPLQPVSTEDLGRPAPRPPYSYLRNAMLELTIGDHMPHWREGLSRYLNTRKP
jgi:dTDP-4-dehydrorhamnose reductase